MRIPIIHGGGQKSLILEIYEYAIHGCKTTNQKPYHVKGINDSPGTIHAYYLEGGTVYSEDVISENTEEKPSLQIVNNFIMNDTQSYLEKLQYFYNLYLFCEVRKRNNFNDFWMKDENVNYFLKILQTFNFDVPNEKTYIKILRPDDNDKIVVFGDIHGSFHTFFRLILRLHRLGVIDLETFRLKSHYKIIFLGDVIDRGNFSLEIVLIILLLIKENPNNVIYNRGNHEELQINNTNGLKTEIQLKSNRVDEIFVAINQFFLKCSSGIYIKHKNKNLFLSHGGFSKHNIDAYLELKTTTKDYILIDDIYYSVEKDPTRYVGTFTRWSDFSNDITCVNRGFQQDSCVELHNLQEFSRKINVSFIIRGHQDSLSNNYIFSNEVTNTMNYTCAGTVLSDNQNKLGRAVIYNNNKTRNATKGCICRIDVSKFEDSIYKIGDRELYNVLTNSTNTDINRMLCRDSFVLIRYDISNVSNFSTSLGNKLYKFPKFN